MQNRFQYFGRRFSPKTLVGNRYFSSKPPSFAWAPIPIGLGIAFLASIHLYKVNRRDRERTRRIQKGLIDGDLQYPILEISDTSPWFIHLYAILPLNSVSRLWGFINDLELPLFLREPIFKLYSNCFNCNLTEMKNKDLKSYKNLSAFFYRELEDGVRKVEKESPFVSPADGTILDFGMVSPDGSIEHVKGLAYPLDFLIGIKSQDSSVNHPHQRLDHINLKEVEKENNIEKRKESDIGKQKIDSSSSLKKKSVEKLLQKKDSKLYYFVIYLAPGDYHRFHSPVDWGIEKQRHFAVSPKMVTLISNLFVLNERVVLLGKWDHGFFSMIPVGATNVGSIKLNFDSNLKTNIPLRHITAPPGTYVETCHVEKGLEVVRGEELGGFQLGSTVVLVFEGPEDGVRFLVERDEKVRVGQSLLKIIKN